MTQENTQTGPEVAETGQDTPKGFEGMAEKMEQCGCCGDMMEKMKSFMSAMCSGSSDNGERNAETDAKTETKDQNGGTAGRE
jgi:hypothetical protein